jgi:ParB-like chromosome segregation protein Spo0J
VTITVLGTEEAEIDTLVSYPGNSRRGSLRVVRESIAALGQYRPLVVRRREGKPDMILCGHTTRDALVAEGHATARIDVLTCSDDEARRVNLIDNRSQELASWDTEALTAQLETFGDDFTATGFSVADAAKVMFGATPELDDGDGDDGELWGVVAECDDEQAQAELLARLDGEGYKVRALIR